MGIKRIKRLASVLHSLPDLFTLQPQSDYNILISHGSQKLTDKAWDMTASQMRIAMRKVEKRSPKS